MTPLDNPEEALASIRSSVKSAESAYDNGQMTLVFLGDIYREVKGKMAPSALQMCINAGLNKILPDKSHEVRCAVLTLLCSRENRPITSSDQLTVAGASALRARFYGPDAPSVTKDTAMLPDAALGVLEAYRLASGQLELFKEAA
jgi:hypothetical protein